MTALLPAETSGNLIGQVHLAECLDLCERVYRAGVRVDMILADLPYGTTACAWDTIIPFEPMWKAFKRIIKPRGAIVLTASQPFTSALVMSNPKMFRYSLVWNKVNGASGLHADVQPIKSHEDICIFGVESVRYFPQMLKADKRVDKPRNIPNGDAFSGNSVLRIYDNGGVQYPKSIITYSNADQTGKVHPTQKPVDLFQYLIKTYTLPNELVFDPTCGSGTTARAAVKEGRRFIVGDNEIEYVQAARDSLRLPFEKRLVKVESDVSDLPLFAQVPA